MIYPGYFFGHTSSTTPSAQECSSCPPVVNCVRKFEPQVRYLHRERVHSTDVPVQMVRKKIVCGSTAPVVDCQQR